MPSSRVGTPMCCSSGGATVSSTVAISPPSTCNRVSGKSISFGTALHQRPWRRCCCELGGWPLWSLLSVFTWWRELPLAPLPTALLSLRARRCPFDCCSFLGLLLLKLCMLLVVLVIELLYFFRKLLEVCTLHVVPM